MEKRRRRPLTKLSVMEFTEFMLQFKRQRGGVGGLDYGQLVKFHFGENFKSKVSLDHTNPMRVFFSFPSKHLKGQLDPPVGNGHIFGPKEVSWTPP